MIKTKVYKGHVLTVEKENEGDCYKCYHYLDGLWIRECYHYDEGFEKLERLVDSGCFA